MTAAPTTHLSLLTPEQVPLSFKLASVGDRIFAATIDLLIIVTTVVSVAVFASLLIAPGDTLIEEASDGELLLDAIVQLAIFVVWNFYFIITELRWRGRTVGKRALGLRVIARDGGPLSADLVFARNLTRDVETLLPLSALLFPQLIGIDSPWLLPIAWLWLGIMALMPLFNRLRARVGDLVAGTLVVEAPRATLLPDLTGADTSLAAADGDEGASPYRFDQAQLDLYGIHELQLLEDVLRRYPEQIDHELLVTIAHKIQRKIGWESAPGQEVESHPFLLAFYAAQRARLEHKLLFGTRQERKIR